MEAFIQRNKFTLVFAVVAIIVGFSIYQFLRISNFVISHAVEQHERVGREIKERQEGLKSDLHTAEERHEAFSQSMEEYMDLQSRALSNPESLEGHPEWERMVREAQENKRQRDIAFEKRKQELIAAEEARKAKANPAGSDAQDGVHLSEPAHQ